MDLCILGELPQNCKEVKRLKGAGEDGEYFLIVTGKLLKVLVRAQSLFLHCFQSWQPWLSWSHFRASPGRFCLVCLSGLLCRDALWPPQGVYDTGPRRLWEFLWGLRAQVGELRTQKSPDHLEIPRNASPSSPEHSFCLTGCTTQPNAPTMGADVMTVSVGRTTQQLGSPASRRSE